MKFVLSLATIGMASAFAPSQLHVSKSQGASTSKQFLSKDPQDVANGAKDDTTYTILTDSDPEPDFMPSQIDAFGESTGSAAVAPINGWVPDESKPCFGLPGVVAPTGFFDPLGFCQTGMALNEVKRYREAEVQHGRVAMLASVGYLAGEAISGPFGLTGPANDQLAQVPIPAFLILTAFIGSVETARALIGWEEPENKPGSRTLWTLRDSYYPGDLGFDPLGLKPTDADGFANMQTRELQNGRLAMLGVAGMCSQELVNHKTVMATIEFYQQVYSGLDPYEGMSAYDVVL